VTPGGSNGEVQYNNSGALGGVGFPFFLDPTKYAWMFDDFWQRGDTNVVAPNAAINDGGLGINFVFSASGSPGNAPWIQPSDSGTFGVFKLPTGATSGNNSILTTGTATCGVPYNATTFDARYKLAISTTSTISFFCGFNKNETGGEASTDYIGIAYDTVAADAGWKAVTRSASGTATRTAISGSTLDTAYHVMRIRSTAAGTILFSVDGGAEISINTTVPSVAIAPQISVFTRTSAAVSVKVDYFFQIYAINR
jgi:hypothetical protein